MSIPLFGEFERLINEHGSATIMKERLELIKEKYDNIEKKYCELQSQYQTIEAEKSKLEIEGLKLKEKLQEMEASHAKSNSERLEKTQEDVLIFLANNPNSTSSFVSQRLHLSPEITEFHLEELATKNFVYTQLLIMAPAEWKLCQEGRRYLISNNLIN